MIWSTPRVVESPKNRWYIHLETVLPSGEKKRIRIYSFKQIGISKSGFGNRSRMNKQEKRQYYGFLLDLLNKKIREGWSPFDPGKDVLTVEMLMNKVKKCIDSQGISLHHQKNLLWIARRLQTFMSRKKLLKQPYLEVMTKPIIEQFLDKLCGRSNGYFNSARKQLSALFGMMQRKGLIDYNPVKDIQARKHTPKRNAIYSPEEQLALMKLCSLKFPNLYLAMLMEFQLLLRPHKEIRLLVRGMFNKDMSLLTIPDGYTKGRMGRRLPVSPVIMAELFKRKVHLLGDQDNIFTGCVKPFNPYYFSTQWRRFRELAQQHNIIKPDQTLYSLRHSAAMQVYRQKNSIEAVKSAMDHAKIRTTFEYLRSLGLRERNLDLDDLPELFI